MVGQAKLEDSNVALMNSDLAKKVREEAATYEKEWRGAGTKPGIEIWRSENLGIKRWPQTEYGSFFIGDSYIVLNTYKAPEGDKLLYNVHFWLGRDTSQDEAGVAAYKTVELDDLLGQLPIQFREVMGSESPEFLKLFKPAMTIMEGGIASGFRHVEPADYKPRLMHIKGKKENSMKVVQVPLNLSSLNDGDSFVLDAGMQLWQWNGSSAGVFEKRQGQAIVNQMKSDRKGLPKVTILDGDEEDEEFWSLLGGRGRIKTAEEGGPDDAAKPDVPLSLLKISDASGSLSMTEVAFAKSSLDTNDVFLLSLRGQAIYIWVGKQASKDERGKAFQFANTYISNSKLSVHTPVVRVTEGQTTRSFEDAFL